MPHISLAMQNDGDVCVCNLNTQSLETGGREKIYLHKHGLESAWNSPTRKMIAAGLDKGVRLPGCQACWDFEDAGITSPRQSRNRLLGDLEPVKSQPKIIIIKPGNVCNLGCRMCNPATSTSLYQDFYQLDTERNKFVGTFKDYTNQFEPIRLGFNSNNDKIWPVLNKWAEQLVFIDIYGGEPMLAPSMWESLELAVDQGYSSHIDLQLHTNATIWQDKYIDILKQYKSVSIGISIDSDNSAQLEYIRHKSNAEQIFANLEKYQQLCNSHGNIECRITLTVSTYNIFDLDNIIKNLRKYQLPIETNFVHSPEHYDIRHIPVSVKKILSKRIFNLKSKTLLDQTLPGCDVQWPIFCQEVALLDKIRNQNFADVFTEWYSLLEPFMHGQKI